MTGAWRSREARLIAWLIATSLISTFIADVGWSVFTVVLHETPAPLNWTSAPYLGFYVLLGAATVNVLRRSGDRDVAALIDAAIVTVGVGVVAFVFLISDLATASGESVLTRFTTMLFPLADVFLIGIVVRLVLGRNRRRGPITLVAAAVVSHLAGDVIYDVLIFTGETVEARRWADVAWLTSFVWLGCTLWHPAAGRLGTRGPATDGPAGAERQAKLGVGRLALLGTAGVLAPISMMIREKLNDDPHLFVVGFGGIILLMLCLARIQLLVQAVEAQQQLLKLQARTDMLTGLANRRTFDFHLERGMRAVRDSTSGASPLAVALIDLDNFKNYNDSKGHDAGDQLLRQSATHWSDELDRQFPGAVLARYGGEEFVVILPGRTASAAADVLRALLARTPQGQTFSAGTTTWDEEETAQELLRRADALMYRAKDAGRNRVLAGTDSFPLVIAPRR